MPFGGLLSAGIGGLAGLFGGGKQQKQSTDTTTTQNQNQSGTFSNNGTTSGFNTPVLSPFQTALAGQFTKGAQDLYNQSKDMTGYTQQGLEGINQANANAGKSLSNTIASRGLSFSPTATNAQTQARMTTAGQQSQFMSQVPLLQRQLQSQALQQMMGAFQVLPTGSTSGGTTAQSGNQNVTSSGTTHQVGNGAVSGNPIAGALGGFGAGIANAGIDWGNLFGGGGNPPGYNLGDLDRNVATNGGSNYNPNVGTTY